MTYFRKKHSHTSKVTLVARSLPKQHLLVVCRKHIYNYSSDHHCKHFPVALALALDSLLATAWFKPGPRLGRTFMVAF